MSKPVKPHRVAWRLIGGFLGFGSLMLTLAAATLLWSATDFAKGFWSIRPDSYAQLSALGWPVIAGFAALAVVFTVTTIGWFRRRTWGWIMGVVLIGANVVGDIAQLIQGHIGEGLMGVAIGGALLAYMLSPPIRACLRPAAKT